MNCACPQTDPIEERRAGHIYKLPEKVLIEIHRRLRVATDGELNTGIEHKAGISQPHDRRDAYVENRVVGVVPQNQGLAGNGTGGVNVAFLEISTDRQQMVGVIAEGGADAGLLRG